jgi:hypothetical protein
MRADIFIKTYAGDVGWLAQCVKHLRHYAQGFRRIVVVAPPEIEGQVRGSGLLAEDLLIKLNEPEDGYIFQQQCKLNAHNFTDADYVCFVDSDCLAKRHFRPEDFFVNGKPHFLYTPWENLDASAHHWRAGTETVLRQSVPYEFMRRHPAFYPRHVLQGIDAWFQSTHHLAASQFMRQHGRALGLSEFNIMGAWSWFYRRDDFTWLSTVTDSFPPDFVEQFWSYGGPDHPSQADRYRAVAL